jgi:hypothetical protein
MHDAFKCEMMRAAHELNGRPLLKLVQKSDNGWMKGPAFVMNRWMLD